MKKPSLPSVNVQGLFRKFLMSDKPKFKSALTIFLAVLPAIILLWIWIWGADFRFRDDYPLRPVSARWLATLGLFLIVISWVGYCARRRVRELEKLKLDVELSVVDPIRKDIEFQTRYLDYWLGQLRRHLGNNNRSLYQRPWYLVLGAENSGKNTLFSVNLSLLDLAPQDRVVSEEGLDLYVRCSLTDKAVLLMPRGRLITQPHDSNEKPQLYHRLWQSLLGWMVSERTRQPLNGIILTIDISRLITADKEAGSRYFADIYLRLQEIRQAFSTRHPVYIVLTKLDLLQGFNAMFQSLDIPLRESVLGVTFTPDDQNAWLSELTTFWEKWIAQLNAALPEMMLNRVDDSQRSELFSFIRQMVGLQTRVADLLQQLIGSNDEDIPLIRGIYLTSSTQRGQIDDIFTQSAAVQYNLPVAPTNTWPVSETFTYFTGQLFRDVLFSEPNLATENHFWLRHHHHKLFFASTATAAGVIALWTGWHHYYDQNYQAGENVLSQVSAFSSVAADNQQDTSGVRQLPVLNPLYDATSAYGNYREKNGVFTDLGLYQGKKIGPYVEKSYLQLLIVRFLQAIMAGLQIDLNNAPENSEEKLAILRVMRMLEDKSGRNDAIVKAYLRQRWSREFTGQNDIQSQLMSHLDYALEHTDWAADRNGGDAVANRAYLPFAPVMKAAQKELSQLSLYQRVYQTLRLKGFNELAPPLDIRHQVGPGFSRVFVSLDDEKLEIPQFLTRNGLINYFIRQNEELVDLTALDAWVLNLSQNVKYSESDRREIQHQISEQYLGDYTANWRAAMSNLEIREFDTISDEISALEQIISGEQPLRRALQILRDNTSLPVVDSNLTEKEKQALMAQSQYRLLSRINREFAPQTEILVSNNGDNLQNINQKLNELHRYLLSIENAPVPGKAALKAVFLRLEENNRDAIFEVSQMAKTMPEPLGRWVGELADQAWIVVQKEAIRYLEVEWNESVVKQYNSYIAGRYPFDPKSTRDVPLSEFERFFKPGGTLDAFYQQNLRPFAENNLLVSEDGQSLIRPDVMEQIETANRIRNAFFTAQGNLETQFAVEPVQLSGNKRRSILNLDGQILDYAHGRSNVVHMIWPNSMRSGGESKLTLVSDVQGKSPRAIINNGPWAQIRLIQTGKLTNVTANSFDVRFAIDDGEMSYRIYMDEADNPFSGNLFSRFSLPETLY
ncbi:MAG TPA: type VI secretion system membrane subunit TssM [Morganella sp. (in: Bacteria)]|nr:type VI secretion system membrane subunit TssM [Morganella sp. (in: enterobacteria)]